MQDGPIPTAVAGLRAVVEAAPAVEKIAALAACQRVERRLEYLRTGSASAPVRIHRAGS